MRVRLQLLLPLVVVVVVAVSFLAAALFVGDAVRGSLATVPGLTADRAVESAVRVVAVAGAVVTVLAGVAGAILARVVVAPLSRLRAAVERLPEQDVDPERDTPVAEIRDVARGVRRAAGELRDRYGREVREREALAGLVEAVSEGIIQVGTDGRITRANRASRELLRLPDDPVGRPVGTLLRNPALRRIMERGGGTQATEAAEVVVEERRILVSVTPQDAGGVVATLVDLTDLRRLEEVRRDFVANASHELKTPLTSIGGYSETLLGGELPEAEQKRFLAAISRNAGRLQRIVDDLLDLSRLEAGRWQPELEAVDVLKVAERCWRAFAERAAERGVSFSAGADTAARARADHRALEQIFTNLYDNALRHTDQGGSIRVTAQRQETVPGGSADVHRASGMQESAADVSERGPWLVAEVTDTGAGIPRDALPRIFERFYRVDPARSRAEGGTGLGLSIVRHMVESMGGGVDARSELGKGTTVRIRLPVP